MRKSMEMAQADKIDALSSDAVMLKLIGLSNSPVQVVIQRREQGLPTLTSAQIGRLKNVGESEKKILDLIYQGLSDKPSRSIRRAAGVCPQSLPHGIRPQSAAAAAR